MITIKRAHYLYALLTETLIDFGSLVTAMMMPARLTDWGIALPYGALITRIEKHTRVRIEGIRKFHPEKRTHWSAPPESEQCARVGGQAGAETSTATESSQSWCGTY
jgi:hypothetical protein